MNVALAFLYFIVIVVTILFVYLGYRFHKRSDEMKTITSVASTKCVTPHSEMIDISNLQCCTSGGLLTSSRYSPDLDMVINPVATPYLNACRGWCQSGYVNGFCGGSATYEEMINFQNCIEKIAPKECIGAAMPVAYAGSTLFYASSAGNIGCTTTATCQVNS